MTGELVSMKNFKAQSDLKSSPEFLQVFIPAWVRKILPELKGAKLAVLVAYWNHANRDGLAWPSIRLLEKETGYGKNTLKPARGALTKMGLLVPVQQYRDTDGRWRKKVFSVFTGAQELDHGTAVQFLRLTEAQKVDTTAAQKVDPEGTPVRSNPKRRSSAPAPIRRNSEKKEGAYQPEVIYA
jgi:hypothetical protein